MSENFYSDEWYYLNTDKYVVKNYIFPKIETKKMFSFLLESGVPNDIVVSLETIVNEMEINRIFLNVAFKFIFDCRTIIESYKLNIESTLPLIKNKILSMFKNILCREFSILQPNDQNTISNIFLFFNDTRELTEESYRIYEKDMYKNFSYNTDISFFKEFMLFVSHGLCKKSDTLKVIDGIFSIENKKNRFEEFNDFIMKNFIYSESEVARAYDSFKRSSLPSPELGTQAYENKFFAVNPNFTLLLYPETLFSSIITKYGMKEEISKKTPFKIFLMLSSKLNLLNIDDVFLLSKDGFTATLVKNDVALKTAQDTYLDLDSFYNESNSKLINDFLTKTQEIVSEKCKKLKSYLNTNMGFLTQNLDVFKNFNIVLQTTFFTNFNIIFKHIECIKNEKINFGSYEYESDIMAVDIERILSEIKKHAPNEKSVYIFRENASNDFVISDGEFTSISKSKFSKECLENLFIKTFVGDDGITYERSVYRKKIITILEKLNGGQFSFIIKTLISNVCNNLRGSNITLLNYVDKVINSGEEISQKEIYKTVFNIKDDNFSVADVQFLLEKTTQKFSESFIKIFTEAYNFRKDMLSKYKYIPNVKTEEEDILYVNKEFTSDSGKVSMITLHPDSIIHTIAGDLTGCCQKYYCAGSSCVKSVLTEENKTTFLWMKNGRVHGISYVILMGGVLCFDNIECKSVLDLEEIEGYINCIYKYIEYVNSSDKKIFIHDAILGMGNGSIRMEYIINFLSKPENKSMGPTVNLNKNRCDYDSLIINSVANRESQRFDSVMKSDLFLDKVEKENTGKNKRDLIYSFSSKTKIKKDSIAGLLPSGRQIKDFVDFKFKRMCTPNMNTYTDFGTNILIYSNPNNDIINVLVEKYRPILLLMECMRIHFETNHTKESIQDIMDVGITNTIVCLFGKGTKTMSLDIESYISMLGENEGMKTESHIIFKSILENIMKNNKNLDILPGAFSDEVKKKITNWSLSNRKESIKKIDSYIPLFLRVNYLEIVENIYYMMKLEYNSMISNDDCVKEVENI